jgi:hypothetical protein
MKEFTRALTLQVMDIQVKLKTSRWFLCFLHCWFGLVKVLTSLPPFLFKGLAIRAVISGVETLHERTGRW